jgi:uncharacterized protein (DUF4415 family)
MKESDIDYSDAPKTNAEFWKTAEKNLPPKKTVISIRIDIDVLSWFKARQKKGYQTFINLALRDYMMKHQSSGEENE